MKLLDELGDNASRALDAEGVSKNEQTVTYQVDVRYHGQGLVLTVDVDPKKARAKALETISKKFDEIHTQMFTFALDAGHELVNLRAIVHGKAAKVKADVISRGARDPKKAAVATTSIFFEGKPRRAKIYDRTLLRAGNVVPGPAIVTEMDSTTLVLPGHSAQVDKYGNLLILPNQSARARSARKK